MFPEARLGHVPRAVSRSRTFPELASSPAWLAWAVTLPAHLAWPRPARDGLAAGEGEPKEAAACVGQADAPSPALTR